MKHSLLLILLFSMVKLGGSQTPYIEKTDSTSIDWSTYIVTAKGYSVMDTETFPDEDVALLMAQDGAKAIAQRNLAETIDGVWVTSKTVVENYKTKSSIVETTMSALLRGAVVVGDYSVKGRIVEVTMQVDFTEGGLARMLAGLTDTVETELKNKGQDTTAFIGTPVMFPKVTTESGEELLDYKKEKIPAKYYNNDKLTKNQLLKRGRKILEAELDEHGQLILDKVEKSKFMKVLEEAGKIAFQIGKKILI